MSVLLTGDHHDCVAPSSGHTQTSHRHWFEVFIAFFFLILFAAQLFQKREDIKSSHSM